MTLKSIKRAKTVQLCHCQHKKRKTNSFTGIEEIQIAKIAKHCEKPRDLFPDFLVCEHVLRTSYRTCSSSAVSVFSAFTTKTCENLLPNRRKDRAQHSAQRQHWNSKSWVCAELSTPANHAGTDLVNSQLSDVAIAEPGFSSFATTGVLHGQRTLGSFLRGEHVRINPHGGSRGRRGTGIQCWRKNCIPTLSWRIQAVSLRSHRISFVRYVQQHGTNMTAAWHQHDSNFEHVISTL